MFKKGPRQVILLLIAVAILMGVASVLLGVGDSDTEPPAGEMLPPEPASTLMAKPSTEKSAVISLSPVIVRFSGLTCSKPGGMPPDHSLKT